jgi:hypothetical protein
MIKIDPSKNTKLTFKVAVSGAKDQPQARLLVTPAGSDSFVGIPAKMIGENTEVDLGPLIKENPDIRNANARLEIIVGQKLFIPWDSSLKIMEKTKVEAVVTEAPIIEEVEEDEPVPTPSAAPPKSLITTEDEVSVTLSPQVSIVEDDEPKKKPRIEIVEEEDDALEEEVEMEFEEEAKPIMPKGLRGKSGFKHLL